MSTENKQSNEKPAIAGHVGLAEARTIPILFSTPMVQAILDGRKTQTRRSIKKQPIRQLQDVKMGYWSEEPENLKAPYIKCPYGQPGNILWVRETFAGRLNGTFDYKATSDRKPILGWKPGIHMPKAACRLFLQVKSVRVERLQDISEEDAIAEGANHGRYYGIGKIGGSVREGYFELWDRINGTGKTLENPWVWVVEFERVEKPTGFC